MIVMFISKFSIYSSFFYIFLTSLAFSNNLIELLVSWVGLNISIYAIFIRGGLRLNTLEAGLKYFLVGLLVTCLLFFSVILYSLLYSSFDYQIFNNVLTYYSVDSLESTTNGPDLLSINVSLAQKFIILFTLSAFLFKLGAYPFSFYVADIYENSTWKMLFLYSMPLKVIIFGVFLKFLLHFGTVGEVISPVLVWSALGSSVLGSFSSVGELRLKKFWAHSYVASLGFILFGIVFYNHGMGISTYASKVYFVVYIITWQLIFGIISQVRVWSEISGRNNNLVYVKDLRFLKTGNMLEYRGMVFALISLMGLPPALGFYTKLIVYLTIFENSNYLFLILMVVLAPISGYAYLRLLLPIIVGDLSSSKGIIKKQKSYFCGWFNTLSLSIGLVYLPLVALFSNVITFILEKLTIVFIFYPVRNSDGDFGNLLFDFLIFLVEFLTKTSAISLSLVNWVI